MNKCDYTNRDQFSWAYGTGLAAPPARPTG